FTIDSVPASASHDGSPTKAQYQVLPSDGKPSMLTSLKPCSRARPAMYSAIWSPPLDGVNPANRFEMFRKSTSGSSPAASSRIAWYMAGATSDEVCECDVAETSIATTTNRESAATGFTGAPSRSVHEANRF